ncbi:MoaD/ThiS family protein [Candidatus Thorarchaeota archaeon]|nr:MAG: MoaD/ThiS family protein [Candidatus Thorarchaeota archaeon]
MRVQVKLYATLREYAPSDNEIGTSFDVELKGSTIEDLIKFFGFEFDKAKIIMVNGTRVFDLKIALNEDDLIVIFPPVGGGGFLTG